VAASFGVEACANTSPLNQGDLDVSGLGFGLNESSVSLPAPKAGQFRGPRSSLKPPPAWSSYPSDFIAHLGPDRQGPASLAFLSPSPEPRVLIRQLALRVDDGWKGVYDATYIE